MMCRQTAVAGALVVVLCSTPVAGQSVFHGCAMPGNAKMQNAKTLNRKKNRDTAPRSDQISSAVTLAALLRKGNDVTRWHDFEGAEITGYVFDVKPGGKETCNCAAADDEYKDTHIELVASASRSDKTERVIVEVSPRWRAKMKKGATDPWTTDELKSTLLHKWVRVRGWLMFDEEHKGQAENTNPGNKNNWRATCWEIHPVTRLVLLDGPP
jgi:hypothetical protein